ncbi:carotenoid biosynthesis protein [Mongoliitalea daihaiensis]|uniref:carotenoid biosynthesis protein n=1 Tax=Mongoliitalea daihaiensis TaxID=2782006 RepID=UPI001F28097C|nr:carotenoid biosynthesis protein [Mongoliitalea daihaiensis]UJP65699.1 carotenoid biosynthesis protein [Mongoliitalea daihaiensis]
MTRIAEKETPTMINKLRQKQNTVKFVLTVVYIVGIVGMAIPSVRTIFQALTPIHLLFSLGILLLFHRDWNTSFIVFALAAFSIGFLSEVSGVHTGFPFGNYIYGPVLGVKLWEVPLMIGVNWFLLIYTSGQLVKKYISNKVVASFIGALVMTGIDYLIEPVAVALDFWTWDGGIIPLSNYLGWIGVSFLIQLIYHFGSFQKDNSLSTYLLIHLVIFFAALNFIL